MKSAWIQFAIIGAAVFIPLVFAMFSPTALRAAIGSALVGLFGALTLVGRALYYGKAQAPPATTVLLVLVTGVVVSGLIGWLGYVVLAFFRGETPRDALRKSLIFLGLSMCKIAALLFVIDALAIVATVDFAKEIPEIVNLLLKNYHYPYVGGALAIVVAWGYLRTRAKDGLPIKTIQLVLYLVLPCAVMALLLAPIFMAWIQVGLGHLLLDCANLQIVGYVPDMVDYTRLVLDSVAKGLSLGAAFRIATCAPNEASTLASVLVWVLRLAPITIVAWLALRSFFLRPGPAQLSG